MALGHQPPPPPPAPGKYALLILTANSSGQLAGTQRRCDGVTSMSFGMVPFPGNGVKVDSGGPYQVITLAPTHMAM